MRPRIRILPYRQGSSSVRALARATGLRRINLNMLRFRPRPDDLILNWGAYCPPADKGYCDARWVNHWSAVSVARNKVLALMEFDAHAVPTLEWTVAKERALEWLRDGETVVVRATPTGQGGSGIEVIGPGADDMPDAPLYTKYAKKRTEYRLHVWRGDLLDIQEKRRRSGSEADSRIRSYNNGWIFARENVAVPECVSKAAVAAVNALGLDFGAVDIGYNAHYDKPIVFEVNTAPGLEGTTLERYAEKARELR